MKELFDALPRKSLTERIDYLFDTCFLIWTFENHRESNLRELLDNNTCAITSFNVEELVYHVNRLSPKAKIKLQKFLRDKEELHVLELPIHPGNVEHEHTFVKEILPELDTQEHDPSDAVILAAAIKTRATVLTRDKHDIYNSRLEKFLSMYGISVDNIYPSMRK